MLPTLEFAGDVGTYLMLGLESKWDIFTENVGIQGSVTRRGGVEGGSQQGARELGFSKLIVSIERPLFWLNSSPSPLALQCSH